MCERMPLASGGFVITCGERRREKQFCEICGRTAVALCDWKVTNTHSGLCDRPVCAQHSKEVAPGKHLCPEHQLRYDDWKTKHKPAQGEFTFKEAA